MAIKILKFSWLVIIVVSSSFVLSFAEHKDASYLRKKFYLSVDDSETAKSFIKELTDAKDNSNPLINGYLAATNMVMAKHAINPYKKFKHFADGKKELEVVIQNHEKNLELRLIRFAIQSNAPFFLGYSKDLDLDKKYLIENIGKLKSTQTDKDLSKLIVSYLQKSGLCTSEEAEKLQKISF